MKGVYGHLLKESNKSHLSVAYTLQPSLTRQQTHPGLARLHTQSITQSMYIYKLHPLHTLLICDDCESELTGDWQRFLWAREWLVEHQTKTTTKHSTEKRLSLWAVNERLMKWVWRTARNDVLSLPMSVFPTSSCFDPTLTPWWRTHKHAKHTQYLSLCCPSWNPSALYLEERNHDQVMMRGTPRECTQEFVKIPPVCISSHSESRVPFSL